MTTPNTIFEHVRLSGLTQSGDSTHDFTYIYTQWSLGCKL